jgi:hypothetical protein
VSDETEPINSSKKNRKPDPIRKAIREATNLPPRSCSSTFQRIACNSDFGTGRNYFESGATIARDIGNSQFPTPAPAPHLCNVSGDRKEFRYGHLHIQKESVSGVGIKDREALQTVREAGDEEHRLLKSQRDRLIVAKVQRGWIPARASQWVDVRAVAALFENPPGFYDEEEGWVEPEGHASRLDITEMLLRATYGSIGQLRERLARAQEPRPAPVELPDDEYLRPDLGDHHRLDRRRPVSAERLDLRPPAAPLAGLALEVAALIDPRARQLELDLGRTPEPPPEPSVPSEPRVPRPRVSPAMVSLMRDRVRAHAQREREESGESVDDWNTRESPAVIATLTAVCQDVERRFAKLVAAHPWVAFRLGLAPDPTVSLDADSRPVPARRVPRYVNGKKTPTYESCTEAHRRAARRLASMDPRWFADYEVMLPEVIAEIGERPTVRSLTGKRWKHSLDCIDNTKGYWPGNIRWGTSGQQGRNRGPRKRRKKS